jgi:hypothetical protein
MNVPRPLLVVVVVIVILGVVACGAGVIRGRMDAAGPTPPPTAQFGGFGEARVPSRDVRAIGGGCSRTDASADIAISGTCLLRIDPQSLRPRSLRLIATFGNVDSVVVTQTIRGETRTSDPDSFGVGDDPVKISVAGTSPVDVNLSCGSCSVQIQD